MLYNGNGNSMPDNMFTDDFLLVTTFYEIFVFQPPPYSV